MFHPCMTSPQMPRRFWRIFRATILVQHAPCAVCWRQKKIWLNLPPALECRVAPLTCYDLALHFLYDFLLLLVLRVLGRRRLRRPRPCRPRPVPTSTASRPLQPRSQQWMLRRRHWEGPTGGGRSASRAQAQWCDTSCVLWPPRMRRLVAFGFAGKTLDAQLVSDRLPESWRPGHTSSQR